MAIAETTTKLLVAIAIIVVGILIARIGSSLIFSAAKRKDIIKVKHVQFVKVFRYTIFILTLLGALIYLRVDFSSDISFITNFLENTYNLLPTILLVILIMLLALVIVNLIVVGLRRFFDTAGITEFMIDQRRGHILNAILVAVRISLYIFTALFLLNLFGINIEGITQTISWTFYAAGVLLFLYIFFGTKSIMKNFITGIYLKSSQNFRLGQKVKIDEAEGTIKSISNQGVTIKSDFGYSTFIPNNEFVKKDVSFKNIETDLDTLEKIKGYYVEQKPSYCGPACASMILKIFGHTFSQSKIGDMCNTKIGTDKKPAGTKPKTLIEVVEKLTKHKVKGAWITVDNISDLKNEIRLWLDEGALVIVDYKKSFLFPESKKAHYTVVVAVEGDELVMLDPSGVKGGVYLADAEKVLRGMDTYSEFLKSKRGYLVLAPEGTTGFHRIEEGLIYANPNVYKELSQNLKKKLYSFTEKAEGLESVLPLRVKSFIKKWKEKDKIARLWKPDTVR